MKEKETAVVYHTSNEKMQLGLDFGLQYSPSSLRLHAELAHYAMLLEKS
jgi:hypothetical protein